MQKKTYESEIQEQNRKNWIKKNIDKIPGTPKKNLITHP